MVGQGPTNPLLKNNTGLDELVKNNHFRTLEINHRK